jgi:broad specificity phosphatase PhoE
MRIFLIRHGVSTANLDSKVHHELPDHAIPLAPQGLEQAERAREVLEQYLSENRQDRTLLWRSPYTRTRQTAEVLAKARYLYTKDLIVNEIKENICLCEQKFGLFDGLSNEELKAKFPEEYNYYDLAERFGGRFWAQMPLGESRYDVALRVHQIFGTWKRDQEKHGIDTVIVVSHGVTIRAIVMRWLDLPYEWFEQEPNPGNCSIRLLDGCEDKGYLFKGFARDGTLIT